MPKGQSVHAKLVRLSQQSCPVHGRKLQLNAASVLCTEYVCPRVTCDFIVSVFMQDSLKDHLDELLFRREVTQEVMKLLEYKAVRG